MCIATCQTDSSGDLPEWHRELSSVLCGDLEGWDGGGIGREVQEGGNIGIHTADSLRCTEETNSAL